MPYMPTNHQVRKSIRQIAKVTKDARPEADQKADEKTGLQEAFLKKIDLKNLNENGWQIEYTIGGTEWVGMSTPDGIDSLPEGEVINGILYPKEDIIVDVVQDSSLRESRIISTRETNLNSDVTPGTTQIVRGQSQFIVENNQITFITPKFKVDTDMLEGVSNQEDVDTRINLLCPGIANNQINFLVPDMIDNKYQLL